VNNALIGKSTTYYTFDSVKGLGLELESTTYYTLDTVEGSPYTLSSDGRTVEDHASIEFLQRDRESLEESFTLITRPHTAC
jgi:hypothetical protein